MFVVVGGMQKGSLSIPLTKIGGLDTPPKVSNQLHPFTPTLKRFYTPLINLPNTGKERHP